MAIVFGLLFALPWLFVFANTWERPDAVRPQSDGLLELFKSFASTGRNRTFRIHMGMYLSAFLNLDLFNGLIIFYATLSLGQPTEVATRLPSLVQASQLLALPLVTWLCIRLGNAGTYRLSLAVWGLGIVALASQPHGSSYGALLPWAILTGIGLSGSVMTPWNIQAFMADVDELITGERREGVYAGAMQFCRQLAIGLGLFLAGKILAVSGFVKGAATQPPEVGEGVRMALEYAPLLCLGTGIALSLLFRLDPANHRILLAEIGRLKDGGSKDYVSPETRKVCETLTGLKYENLWRTP